jgi:periplasmic divalent cation tolerance protein
MHLIEIHTTVATIEDAQDIANHLVDQKLAACAQITEIKSYYHWDGALQVTVEFRITLKTTDRHYTSVEAAIRERHPYTLPAIYAVPVTHAFAPYANWVTENITGPDSAAKTRSNP